MHGGKSMTVSMEVNKLPQRHHLQLKVKCCIDTVVSVSFQCLVLVFHWVKLNLAFWMESKVWRFITIIHFHFGADLKGRLRALPTEIISPAKWRSNRKWRPTNGPADRLATKFSKISSFWWVFQWAAAATSRSTGPGNMSLRDSAPSAENIVRSRLFVFSEVDGWLAAKVDQ